MIYFIDSNIFVNIFLDSPQKDKCRQFLSEDFITDSLCIIETGNVILKISKDRTFTANCLRSLYRSQGIIKPIDTNLAFEAMKKLEKSNLSFYDLTHYICALMNTCDAIVSYDKAFDGLEIKRLEP